MSDSSEVLVKRAGPEDAALVGEILADAFAVDPVGKWICPDPEYPRWCWPVAVPFLLGQMRSMWLETASARPCGSLREPL